jgi:hypothetical protein
MYNSEVAAAKHDKQVNKNSTVKIPNKKDAKPEYLMPLLQFTHKNMSEYSAKV